MPDREDPRKPRCTYRLQLRAGFGFAEAAELLPYLTELGVSHCYTSPFFKARPGSNHGYDVVDPNAFNPEIGDEAAFRSFATTLADHGLALLVDVVPNHMGVMGSDNLWWLDVLENGQASAFAAFFDIDWHPLKRSLRNRLLVPVLGDQYGRELEAGRIRLAFDGTQGSLAIRYFDHLFPLDPRTYPLVLRRNLPALTEHLGAAHPDHGALHAILADCAALPGRRTASAAKIQQRRGATRKIKEALAALAAANPVFLAHLQENIRQLNGTPADRHSFAELHQLLERQVFRLSFWKVAAEEINYRRFFDLNDLAGLRVEREEVFGQTHRLLFRLVEEGAVAGLRIDHVDGLYDPLAYLRRLQQRLAILRPEQPPWLVVEKILADREELPPDWPVHGTTGYDFGVQVTGLLLDPAAAPALDRLYRRLTGSGDDFAQILAASKKRILTYSLAGELNMLANRLDRLSESDWQSRDFTLNALHQALAEVIVAFPAYRTYITGAGVSGADRQAVQAAVRTAKRLNPGTDRSIFDFIETLLLQQQPPPFRRSEHKRVLDFTMRFQQLTAPVTAKGMEDTAFYRYNRLVALNEVGGDPSRFGLPVAAFHQRCQERLTRWPRSMLATSTHDSKRSEDVRARLAVLSEATADWSRAVHRWRRLNRSLKRRLADGRRAPDANEEYLLYQNLFGFWPLTEPDKEDFRRLRERLAGFMQKALREAKRNTSWRNPDEEYEAAVLSFVERLFAAPDSQFWLDFLDLHRRLAPFGLYNSLSQTLLKLTVPGVPDIYQGCELWNFCLVDPDNRQPVDFESRRRLLRELVELSPAAPGFAEEIRRLAAEMADGRIKMYLTIRCLTLRRQHPRLFAEGSYEPLAVTGKYADHACAFLRRFSEQLLLVAAPRLCFQLTNGAVPAGSLAGMWEDTAVVLPEELAAAPFIDQLTGERVQPEANGSLPVVRLLQTLPASLLVRADDSGDEASSFQNVAE